MKTKINNTMLKKEFTVDKLLVKVYDNRQSMGQAAADEAVAYLKELLANQDEVWAIFGAAPSQNEILAGLGKMYVADEITPDIWRVRDENGNIPNQIDCAKMLLEKMGL